MSHLYISDLKGRHLRWSYLQEVALNRQIERRSLGCYLRRRHCADLWVSHCSWAPHRGLPLARCRTPFGSQVCRSGCRSPKFPASMPHPEQHIPAANDRFLALPLALFSLDFQKCENSNINFLLKKSQASKQLCLFGAQNPGKCAGPCFGFLVLVWFFFGSVQ
jgi:hypothetical protein